MKELQEKEPFIFEIFKDNDCTDLNWFKGNKTKNMPEHKTLISSIDLVVGEYKFSTYEEARNFVKSWWMDS